MRRQGFTKIELAIVMSVVAILVAVLLPGIARMREAAARTETNNNLKSCALAVHNYHDTYRKLPDAYSTGGTKTTPVSLWFHLLPFLKQGEIYNTGRLDAIVPEFIAPSDRSTENRAGTLSFAANIRLFAYDTITPAKANTVETALDVPHGVLRANLTLSRIVDGTTNTFMLSTRYANCNSQTTWYATDAHGQCSLGEMPSPGFGGFMGAGSHSTPPTAVGPISAIFQLNPTVRECLPDVGVFGHSFGSGGLSMALCDASLKNISPTMSPKLFSSAMAPGDSPWNGGDWVDN